MGKIRYFIFTCFLALAFAAVGAAQSPSSNWANFRGNKVNYYDIGGREKKAIILVHGWTCNADFWKESYSAFPGYRVIAIDLPGHGKSDKPQTDYSMDYFARSIDSVMKAAKVSKAVLVGHSMGTPVIRQFYRVYPQQTAALVVVDGALRPLGDKADLDKFFGPLFADYRKQAPIFVDDILSHTRADLRAMIRSAMLSTPEYVGTSAMKGMLDEKIWTNDQIKVPALAIMAESANWPKDNESQYKKVAPDLEFHLWQGVGHFLMMEKPSEFNATVRSFVVKNKLL